MAGRTIFKAWIAKYALTKGIYEVEVEDCFHTSPDMVDTTVKGLAGQTFYKNQWFRTEQEAKECALALAKKKKELLLKQVKKMDNLIEKFS